MKVIFRKYIL